MSRERAPLFAAARVLLGAAVMALAIASSARAHFVFVVPDAGARTAKVILSESLEPDEEVSIIAAATLSHDDASGASAPLTLTAAGAYAYDVALPSGAGVVRGIADLGVIRRGKSKPGVLTYYPKAILGDPFAAKAPPPTGAPVELVPLGRAGMLKLRLLAASRPVPNAEVDVILPDGTDRRVMTDAEGDTPAFEPRGRYGAWARHVEAVAGERDGKPYEEVRRYATLVIDVPAPATSAAKAWAPMPEAASSFGAVASEGWLYVYGGHTADTHTYAKGAVSGRFHRLSLADRTTWEELPSGTPLQGMNLAAWRGKIYRVGGMTPLNEPGAPPDLRSVTEAACYDPAARTWTALPPLPEPRSSHDLAVIGDTLFVTGGWDLSGPADGARWMDATLSLDLASQRPQWKPTAQPVRRRAFTAAAARGRLYVIGGLGAELKPDRRVDVLDPATGTWTRGPDLPGFSRNGFGAAAATLDGDLYVSVADGTLQRLDRAGSAWEKVAETTPRIVHRLIPNGRELLVVGGADGDEQLSLIEAVAVPEVASAAAGQSGSDGAR